MSLRRGVRQVVCKECGASGEIRIGAALSSGRRVKVSDNVEHLDTCSHYVRAQPRHLKRRGWVQQEKKMNKEMGARATLASGAVGKDGDGRVFHKWRVECKRSIHGRYRLTQETWTKLVRGALEAGEEPVLQVHLSVRLGNRMSKRVVIRLDHWESFSLPDELRVLPKFRNPLSFRLEADAPVPLIVELDPPGVMMDEDQFLRIPKEDQ